MARAGINAILAHDEAVPAELVADHIPADSGVTLREVSSVLFPATEALRASDADVLLVGCGVGSEDALSLIEWWTSSRPGRPVVVLCARAASNGFVEEVFAAGADDLLVLDDAPEVVCRDVAAPRVRVPEGGRAQGQPGRGGRGDRQGDLRARAQGRDRQDDHLVQPRDRAGDAQASASCSSIWTSSSATSRCRSG